MSNKKEPQPTPEQIEQWKAKALQWDALGKKIAAFYVDIDGDEVEDGGDLGDIGEVAAIAYGWL